MTKKQRRLLKRIIISAVLLAAIFMLDTLLLSRLSIFVSLLAYLIPYIIIGYDILRKSVLNIINGNVFDENLLMSIATLGALLIGFLPNSEAQFVEAVFVMLFYQVGELFQSIAVEKSRRSISELMKLYPDTALVWREGRYVEVEPDEICVGEQILVNPGDKIALDGKVISGNSTLNTVALTGEAVPRVVTVGDVVLSGCINMSGVLTILVTKPFCESTVSKILALVEESTEKKAKAENFLTKFARWYTPMVVIAALALAIITPVFAGNFLKWLSRALTFLIVSCPCALVVSVPLSFFSGIGRASKSGILIKGSNYIEALAKVETAVFDKTGTLTKGEFTITEISPAENFSAERLIKLAAAAERHSNHPIALSLKEICAWADSLSVCDVTEIAGCGISATVDGVQVKVGNSKIIGAKVEQNETGSAVYVAVDGQYAGKIVLSDSVKPEAFTLIGKLKSCGVKRTVMLTGDKHHTAKAVADLLGIDEFDCELLPADKVARVETLMSNLAKGGTLCFVGDGINDAPVLSRADIGITMGALGSDAAIEAGDIVIMNDDPSKLVSAIKISKKTMRIVKQNIWFALMIKLFTLLLCAVGVTSMGLAVFADVGVLILAILNATRAYI